MSGDTAVLGNVATATPTAIRHGRRPRVALVQTQAEGAGAQEISRILARGLEERGYDVHHVFFYRRTAAFDAIPNTFFCASEHPRRSADLARMLARLTRHLRGLRPDAALCFQHYGNIVGAVAARFAGVPTVIANRTSARSLEPRWTQVLDRRFGQTGLFTRVVVNSKAIADEYDGHPAAYRRRVVRIDHGFEAKITRLGQADARSVFNLPQDVPLLGCAARLHPTKNLAAAVRLLTADPTWHLALAGQGPARDDLEILARSLGVADRVHFVGELPATEIGTFLKTLDAFVFPSEAESFGLAVVEAAQSGVPVVSNDLEVLREVLAVDGEPCALLVDANDPAAFAAAVRRLLTDGGLRDTLSARASGLAERYSLDKMVESYAALLGELAGKARQPAR